MAHGAAEGYVRLRAQHGAAVLKCAKHEECFTGNGALLRLFPVPGGQARKNPAVGLPSSAGVIVAWSRLGSR